MENNMDKMAISTTTSTFGWNYTNPTMRTVLCIGHWNEEILDANEGKCIQRIQLQEELATYICFLCQAFDV